MPQNSEPQRLYALAKDMIERYNFENPKLALELAEWIINGNDTRPAEALGPRDVGLMYGVMTGAFREVFGNSFLLLADSDLQRRLDQAAPLH